MGGRQGCNDIARAMLENEFKKYTEEEKMTDSRILDYSEKLYPFLDKLCELSELKICEKRYKQKVKIKGKVQYIDKIRFLDLEKCNTSTYDYFKDKMSELSIDFGTENIYSWIPSVATLNKDQYSGKWVKSKDGVLFVYRLNVLLFNVASRQNPKIKDKTYYDRLRNIQKEYYEIFQQLDINPPKSMKKEETEFAKGDSESTNSYLERIEKEIEDRRQGIKNGETISLIRKRDNILRTVISSYRRKNVNGCYNKEIRKLKNKLEDSRGYIFIKDYFNEYLKLSLKNNEYQFPYELYGDREEIYFRCKDEYENNPEQDIDKMIHDITQSVYIENM